MSEPALSPRERITAITEAMAERSRESVEAWRKAQARAEQILSNDPEYNAALDTWREADRDYNALSFDLSYRRTEIATQETQSETSQIKWHKGKRHAPARRQTESDTANAASRID